MILMDKGLCVTRVRSDQRWLKWDQPAAGPNGIPFTAQIWLF